MSLDRLHALFQRILSYPPWEVAVELILIGLVVWAVLRFVSGTRAAGALKGLLLVVVFVSITARIIGGGEAFQRLGFLYDRFLAIVAIALVVIFQPELRRALIRLGETPLFRSSSSEITVAADAIAQACVYLAKSRFGALIVIERQIALKGIVEGGTVLSAELTAPLLQTIFFPGTALHDLAVVVKGNVVHAAGVQLPLADPSDMPDPQLGSRHRAAVGLAKECDALVVVVSEETGSIRIAERGRLSEPIPPTGLRDEILHRLKLEPPAAEPQTAEEAHQTRIMSVAPSTRDKEDAA
jgi:diadenylate cyclase